MKKILSLTMALAMIGTALTGCGSKDTATQTPAENTQQTAPVQQEQSQTEKALALINTFATGDTDTARSLLADGYIQHNLAYGTGADAFIGSVEYLASADVKTTVNNIRAFEDGDKVFFAQSVSFSDSVVMNGSIAATVSGLDIYYHSAVYKTVPESYVLTAQDIADRDSGRVVFSYDSDKGADMSETVVNTAQWRKGDRFFLLLQLDGALTKDELVGMACEAARLLAERAA